MNPAKSPSNRWWPAAATLLWTAAMPVLATPAAPAPVRDSFVGEMVAILLPLVFIIAGLLFLLRLLRRRYGLSGGDTTPLSVLQILPVGPRERVVLVKSRAGRVFAIGVGAQSVTFITDLDIRDVAPESNPAVEPAPVVPSNIDGNR